MSGYKMERAGSLDVIEIPGLGPQENEHTVVLLHGYGADANDLAPLSHVLKFPENTRWLIPNGPVEVPLGPFYSGRGWAPLDMEEWQRAMMEGRHRDLSSYQPPELFESQKKVLEMMKVKNVDFQKTIFAGFSQGAMLATQLTLTSSTMPSGLIIFSGTLINGNQWRAEGPKMKGLRYFQSHGRYDDVLPVQGAEKLEEVLHGCGLVGSLLKFDGGHEIPPMALQGAQNYILKLFPKSIWEEHAH